MDSDEKLIPAIVGVAAQVARMFELALELLQGAQALVPAPSLEEVAEMRQGKWPLTREAYLIGLLQRALVGTENLASDLRTLDEETLRNVHEIELSALDFNAMKEAVVRRSASAARKGSAIASAGSGACGAGASATSRPGSAPEGPSSASTRGESTSRSPSFSAGLPRRSRRPPTSSSRGESRRRAGMRGSEASCLSSSSCPESFTDASPTSWKA